MTGTGLTQVTATGAPWTTGNAMVTGITAPAPGGGFVNTISLAGFDQRQGGLGHLRLVSPIRVLTATGSGNISGFAILDLHFVPEPGTAMLLGLGALGLVAAGRRWREGSHP
ncbi:MAG: PEP-CTERM sorting domain-containing protein [Proteobacteria bacterium]|nr:PEP-CTERM sorting domain-containing protein [Pseudomonadota bacterium]